MHISIHSFFTKAKLLGLHLRPKVLHCGKFGNKTQVVCPTFTLVIFEIPQGPSEREEGINRRNMSKMSTMTEYLIFTFNVKQPFLFIYFIFFV